MSAFATGGRFGETPPEPAGKRSAGGGARLFVAVDVGDTVRNEVSRVIRSISEKFEAAKTPPKVTWVKPAALHLTIRFLGEVEEAAVDALRERLAPAIPIAPFDVEWRGLGAFPSARHPRALWLGVIRGAGPLGQIEAEVSGRIGGSIELEAKPLLPHLTLGRVRMPGAGIDWQKILQAVDVRDVRSVVDRVTLYRSELSHRGPHYTGLVSAPLIATSE